MAKRPPPWRWLLYAVGFGLPDRYDEWVFHDLNDRGWRVREIGRIMLLAVPFIVGVMLSPVARRLEALRVPPPLAGIA